MHEKAVSAEPENRNGSDCLRLRDFKEVPWLTIDHAQSCLLSVYAESWLAWHEEVELNVGEYEA